MRGDEDGPGEDRHPEHRHAGRAHADDRGDEVDAAEDGAQTGEREADDPQVAAEAGRVDGVRQRGVGEPAEVGGAARGEEARQHGEPAEQEQPEGEGVQPRERDVGGADLQRHDVVGEAEQDRRGVQQQHDRAVHGEQLVVLLVRQELLPRRRQLGAHQQRHQPACHEEGERRDQIEDRDVLRVRRPQHLEEHGALGRHPRRVRARRDRLRRDGSHCALPIGARRVTPGS